MSLSDTHTFDSVCTACGHAHDRAGSMKPDRSPLPGDIVICINCQHIMIIGSDLHLHDPTDAEIREIAGDPDVIRYQRAIAAAKSARKHGQTGGEEAS